MGLDMYLTRIRKDFNKKETSIEIGYWRKANQIYAYFIKLDEKAHDCHPIEVTIDQLKELRDICKKVLEFPDYAKEVLPTQSGFFFGSTEIDEWYMEDLRNTITIIDYIELTHWNGDKYVFQASW